jgi:hypothetical protein
MIGLFPRYRVILRFFYLVTNCCICGIRIRATPQYMGCFLLLPVAARDNIVPKRDAVHTFTEHEWVDQYIASRKKEFERQYFLQNPLFGATSRELKKRRLELNKWRQQYVTPSITLQLTQFGRGQGRKKFFRKMINDPSCFGYVDDATRREWNRYFFGSAFLASSL